MDEREREFLRVMSGLTSLFTTSRDFTEWSGQYASCANFLNLLKKSALNQSSPFPFRVMTKETYTGMVEWFKAIEHDMDENLANIMSILAKVEKKNDE